MPNENLISPEPDESKAELPVIILASQSPYKSRQLQTLGLAFDSISPSVDESPLKDEQPTDTAIRLALNKVQAVNKAQAVNNKAQTNEPSRRTLIIGCDQVATINGKQFGKPLTSKNAIKQLTQFSDQSVNFFSSVCVLDSQSKKWDTMCTETLVQFRTLTQKQIEHYVQIEQPLDCAGSFKCEGLGIALFKAIKSDDPSALIGLPLIALCTLLKRFGAYPLGND